MIAIDKELKLKIQEHNPYHEKDLLSFLHGHVRSDKNLDIEIGDYELCPVGENHGFSGLYAKESFDNNGYCWKCQYYADELNKKYDDCQVKEFKATLKQFYEHIETTNHIHNDEETE